MTVAQQPVQPVLFPAPNPLPAPSVPVFSPGVQLQPMPALADLIQEDDGSYKQTSQHPEISAFLGATVKQAVIALFFTLIFRPIFSTLSLTHSFTSFASSLLSLFSTLLSRYRLANRLTTLTNFYDLMTIPFILFLFFIHTLSFDEMRT